MAEDKGAPVKTGDPCEELMENVLTFGGGVAVGVDAAGKRMMKLIGSGDTAA
jgi:hypothetical protein